MVQPILKSLKFVTRMKVPGHKSKRQILKRKLESERMGEWVALQNTQITRAVESLIYRN